MYAVFSEDAIVYLGNDQEKALAILDLKPDVSAMVVISQIETLREKYNEHLEKISVTSQSIEQSNDAALETASKKVEAALSEFMKNLDEAGVNSENIDKILQRIKEKEEKTVQKMKEIGWSALKTVGENLTEFGNYISEISKQGDSEENQEQQNQI